jgi:CheY-like chemotaxis protein
VKGHRHGILLVDEDDAFRAAVRDCLTERGMAVMPARHGRAALQLCALGFEPCLIVVDVHEPSVGGNELRRALQYDARLRDIPVVVLPPRDAHRREPPTTGVLAVDHMLRAAERACPLTVAFRRPPMDRSNRRPAARPPRVRTMESR